MAIATITIQKSEWTKSSALEVSACKAKVKKNHKSDGKAPEAIDMFEVIRGSQEYAPRKGGGVWDLKIGSGGGIRTPDQAVNSRLLYH